MQQVLHLALFTGFLNNERIAILPKSVEVSFLYMRLKFKRTLLYMFKLSDHNHNSDWGEECLLKIVLAIFLLFLFFVFLRQDFAVQSRQPLRSFCSPGCPQTHSFPPVSSLLSAGMSGVCHRTWQFSSSYFSLFSLFISDCRLCVDLLGI